MRASRQACALHWTAENAHTTARQRLRKPWKGCRRSPSWIWSNNNIVFTSASESERFQCSYQKKNTSQNIQSVPNVYTHIFIAIEVQLQHRQQPRAFSITSAFSVMWTYGRDSKRTSPNTTHNIIKCQKKKNEKKKLLRWRGKGERGGCIHLRTTPKTSVANNGTIFPESGFGRKISNTFPRPTTISYIKSVGRREERTWVPPKIRTWSCLESAQLAGGSHLYRLLHAAATPGCVKLCCIALVEAVHI